MMFVGVLVASAAVTVQAHSLANIIVNTFGTTESRIEQATSDPVQSSIETRNFGPLHFNEVTFITAHNAHANNFAAGDNLAKMLATNQQYSIYHLLKHVGVRGLMLDIEYDSWDSTIRLVHGGVDFNSFEDVLIYEINQFLNENLDAVITIDLETKGDLEMMREKLELIFENNPQFAARVFRMSDSRWRRHKEWPLIQEMRDADQRVVILCDSSILRTEKLGILWRRDIVIENHWEGLDECTNRYGSKDTYPWNTKTINGSQHWSRLFTMNHFCCATGVESLERVRTELRAGGNNGWGALVPRVGACTAANGLNKKPNYIAIDWAHIGDAFDVAAYLTIGGKIGGLGQKCNTDIDCATGSCSQNHQCQCTQCDARTQYCDGCDAGESCVSVESGYNECISLTMPHTHRTHIMSSGASETKNSFIVATISSIYIALCLEPK